MAAVWANIHLQGFSKFLGESNKARDQLTISQLLGQFIRIIDLVQTRAFCGGGLGLGLVLIVPLILS